ncbi:MAG: hypothetical protein EBV19_10560, partial [Flavobacteriia bacterium]|nr:hypothetical protein [Flavobacteriia bacterium]
MGASPGNDNLIDCLDLMIENNRGVLKNVKPLKNDRQRVFKKCAPQVACQENPGWSPDKIRDQFLNPDTFIDPNRFYRILEEYAQVRFAFFIRSKDSDHVRPYLPIVYSKQMYQYPIKKRPVVVLYGHYGGRINDLYKDDRPHFEIIVSRGKTTEAIQSCFPDIDPFLPFLYERMVYTVGSDVLHVPFIYPCRFLNWLSTQPKYQIIDDYGKLRILQVNNLAYILCYPNAPLSSPIVTSEFKWIIDTKDDMDSLAGVGEPEVYEAELMGKQIVILHFQKKAYLEGCFIASRRPALQRFKTTSNTIPCSVKIVLNFYVNSLFHSKPVHDTRFDSYIKIQRLTILLQSLLSYMLQQFIIERGDDDIDRFLNECVHISSEER